MHSFGAEDGYGRGGNPKDLLSGEQASDRLMFAVHHDANWELCLAVR